MNVVKISAVCCSIQTGFDMFIIAVNLNVFFNTRIGLFPDTGITELSVTRGAYSFCAATHKNYCENYQQAMVLIYIWYYEILVQ